MKYLSSLKIASSTTEIWVTTPQAMVATLHQRKHLMHWVFAKIADGATKQAKNENGAYPMYRHRQNASALYITMKVNASTKTIA